MATAARDVAGKMLACFAPIMAFVASGFEHSVANMYFIPTGLLLKSELGLTADKLSWGSFFVITSYSIHYTKLYDVSSAAASSPLD